MVVVEDSVTTFVNSVMGGPTERRGENSVLPTEQRDLAIHLKEMPIATMTDLPQDVQNKESATFDFGKVSGLLRDGYFRGPAKHEDDSKGGLRTQSLRGDPATHRKSILRKATETNLLEETPNGYATTPRGYDLLEQIMVCEDCGGDEEPVSAVVRTGKYFGYGAIFTVCPSCKNPTSAQNASWYSRDDDSLKEAVRTMESHSVVCYMNGMTLDQAKSSLGL